MKDPKRKHLSNFILSNCRKLGILFKTIDNILNVPQTVSHHLRHVKCLQFCVDKVAPLTSVPAVLISRSDIFRQFELVTENCLTEIIDY